MRCVSFPAMRGVFAVAIVAALVGCAPALALDPVSVPGVGSVSCDQTDAQDPPHETMTDSCTVDSAAATVTCTRVQSTDTPTTGECTTSAAGDTVDCTRYETFIYVSDDDIQCTTTTSGGDSATCSTEHTNDFFVTGDGTRVTGCDTDPASCYVTTQPDTDPDDPAFPVPDGTTPSVTPSVGCPAP